MADCKISRRQTPALAAMLIALLSAQCGSPVEQDAGYASLPKFEHEFIVTDGADTLSPVRLQFRFDTLYVSYNGVARIDMFSPSLERIGSIPLTDPEPLHPTAFAVTDSQIILCDHSKGAVVICDREGKFVNSFGLLPDQETRLSPLAITYHGGVAYFTDIALRRVLAISMVDAGEITEPGELILQIPTDTAYDIGFPSAVHVTLDGRLLIGDARDGIVHVFTCDGRPIYRFDTVTANQTMAPQGFALDGIIDPELQDSTKFDPSNIHTHGRYHVVDGNNGQVHMFNPLGKYIASYPADGRLLRPSDLSISIKTARIYVADPQARRIVVFRYGE
jgi:hypothetical protein